MFLDKTVIVVGAGASFEAGLPLGQELRGLIAKLTNFLFQYGSFKGGDYDFWQQLIRSPQFSGDANRAATACAKIARGISYVSSIDSFLEVHRGDADIQHCAKAAIAKLVLDGERRSKLFIRTNNIYNSLDPAALRDTWYLELAHAVFEGVDASNASSAFAPFTVVSFNYDRCLEWFLFNALQGLYSLDKQDAAAALSNLRVLHPYGDVGETSWLGRAGNVFGEENSGSISRAHGRILTFTEKAVAPEVIDRVRDAISQASTVVFLGFSFHPQNMELLAPEGTIVKKQTRRVFGTSLGMSEQDRATVQNELTRRLKPNRLKDFPVVLPALTCCEFMRQFRRSITQQ
ncbi:SIR2 family protein [uncultured Hyphomicrobium sp.]|jgi:hypothetical protein|uniref:SIR2 family protein n=1 Tax=uncultured Hyphomicrobium sp. TaxID=194373 RepID=UPI0025EF0879|nr:SIR2 family protein [uncultured Hyphomicrobium sp.]